MTLFVAKPPTVDAVKWDGTLEGFERIRALIRRSGQSASWNYRSNGDSENGFTGGWVDITARFINDRDGHTRLYEDCWLLFHPLTGLFEIMNDEKFKSLYTEYEETDEAQ